MKYLLIVSFSLFLTGCATVKDTQHMTDVIVDNKTETVYAFPNEEAMKECEELPLLKGKKGADLYIFGVEVSELYSNCSNSKKTLIESINNIKKQLHK